MSRRVDVECSDLGSGVCGVEFSLPLLLPPLPPEYLYLRKNVLII